MLCVTEPSLYCPLRWIGPELQARCRPACDYLEVLQKNEINSTMRAILVDWLVEVRGAMYTFDVYHTVAPLPAPSAAAAAAIGGNSKGPCFLPP